MDFASHPSAMRVRGFVKPRMSILRERYSPVEWHRTRRADAFILSFPKTGRTWLRLMLHECLEQLKGVDVTDPLSLEGFGEVHGDVPRIRVLHDDEPHFKHPHQLRRTKERYRGKRVVLLVRDPRDAIVSLWFQMTRRWKILDKDLNEFLWQSRGSLRSMVRYYNIWLENWDVPQQTLLVRYEDMLADPLSWLREVLGFLGIEGVSEEVLVEAVEQNRIDRVRDREASLSYDKRLKPGDVDDPESYKARRGVAGGFVDYLSPEDIERATRFIREHMNPRYGYAQGDEGGAPVALKAAR